MALSRGTRLGTFEILECLGTGGMGEVYRAWDTKLEREAAVKVLPEVFAQDRERLARLGREAKVLAALDHPNIGTIYDFQEADGVHFLVLQFVEGKTLSERIQQRPLPVKGAVDAFMQVALALEAAHEGGIIHRDLKPSNIVITKDGVVKVIDFGLAKWHTPSVSATPDSALQTAPTDPPLSVPGVSFLGTPSYMSPERLKGGEADRRADIWALGCSLYEALTGRRPFLGIAQSETKAILERECDWGALPKSTPESVRRLLRRCLAKDPQERLRDAGDVRIELKDAFGVAPGYDEVRDVEDSPTRRALKWGFWCGVAVGLVLGWLVAVVMFRL